ncbi:hypothetical protein RG963_09865 [Methanosarcina sp. Z-7115]|uniref:Glycosyltransferase RgtA/B/C/D-like domain-containing protein n=1 Tax=Methanosarcina baikalica TaxID=3073890 RepID=A0ABU2D262_9EURY|nr:hypothetical protein [Methanosarcina sp. Z-7115]MDR7666074.1 hypothetical protein [Methanosarcina sp. Z-7115]
MIFKEIAPYVILLTLFPSIILATKIEKKVLREIDGLFALMGLILGLLITFINLIYSNNYLITLGPLLTLSSLLYLRLRPKILEDGEQLLLSDENLRITRNNFRFIRTNFPFNFQVKMEKVLNTLFWILFLFSLVIYNQAEIYHRPSIFFIFIAINVAVLSLGILVSDLVSNKKISNIMIKILLLSLLVRLSAYFISPYPVGSDPWGHADMIEIICKLGTFSSLEKYTSYGKYYGNFPIMHVYTAISALICDLATKQSMAIIGMIVPLSTIFVYLIAKNLTNNTRIALLSMLMLNFADFHIEWSIEVIPMSFGLAIYTMILYMTLERNKNEAFYASISILFISIIMWTHTVSSFIAVVSIVSIYIGRLFFRSIYGEKNESDKFSISLSFCALVLTVLIYHWMMNPQYPFFDLTLKRLVASLSMEAGFLERTTISNIQDSFDSILNIGGFLIYIFLGVIGSLSSISRKYTTRTSFSFIFMLVLLYGIFFTFPLMGMRNIMPYRWPAFIYVSFVMFSGLGMLRLSNLFKKREHRLAFISIIFLLSSFLMTTNLFTNMDSPIYAKEINQRLVSTESEIQLFKSTNNSYSGIIVADLQTARNQYEIYQDRKEVADYPSTILGDINWKYMDDKLVIWRKVSLQRPVQIHGEKNPRMLLGIDFKNRLDRDFNAVYDTGDAKAYLGIK